MSVRNKPIYYIVPEDIDKAINILKQIPGHTFRFNGCYFQFDDDYLRQVLELVDIHPKYEPRLSSLFQL